MQYQLIGNQPLGKGPLVVLLDKSGSMDGPRDIWATALSLALLDQAQRERRPFALVAFDYRVKFEAVVKPGEPLPEAALFTACAGGTEIADAVARGLEIIQNQPWPPQEGRPGLGHRRRERHCHGSEAPEHGRRVSTSRQSAWASASRGVARPPGATTSRSSRTSTTSTPAAPRPCSPQ